jgi:hypothetical protein
MYSEKIGGKEYFADVVTDGPFDASFLKLWWNKDGEEIALLLYPGGGLEYIVDDFTEKEGATGTYRQLASSLSEEAVENGRMGIGAWKHGLIRFSYWVDDSGIFFADENSDDEVKSYKILDILDKLNCLKPIDVKSIVKSMKENTFEEALVKIMDAYDKNPCPFKTERGKCFADGEGCNHYRKFVYYGYTCPRYHTNSELGDVLFDKV